MILQACATLFVVLPMVHVGLAIDYAMHPGMSDNTYRFSGYRHAVAYSGIF